MTTKVHPSDIHTESKTSADKGQLHHDVGRQSLLVRGLHKIEKRAEQSILHLMLKTHEPDNSYAYYLRMHGPSNARSQLTTALSTIGVVDALILSIASPNLGNPPSALLSTPREALLLVWFWLSLLSVVTSFLSLIISVMILIVGAPVPDDGFEAFLHRIKTGFLFSLLMFTFSVSSNIITLSVSAFLIVPTAHSTTASIVIGLAVLAVFLYGFWLWRIQRFHNHNIYEEYCHSKSTAGSPPLALNSSPKKGKSSSAIQTPATPSSPPPESPKKGKGENIRLLPKIETSPEGKQEHPKQEPAKVRGRPNLA